jgi:lipopolysaccharide biosynthesis glycosyltransferase
MHIACVVDRAYVPHCGVMLHSLLSHATGSTIVHLLHGTDLQARDLSDLGRVVQRFDAELVLHPMAHEHFAGLPMSARFPAPEWYRLRLPELLNDVERVICLDCDLVVLDSLQPLWEMPLDGAVLAAVTDPLFPHLDARWVAGLGIRNPADYFNSGVLVMDLQAMRTEGAMPRVAEFARGHAGPLPYPFQDALNALFHGRRLRLHPRWNVQTTFYERGLAPVFAAEPLRSALADPAIVHFLGPWKPWHYRCKHPQRALYARFRAQTPWAQWQLEGRTLKHRFLRLLPEPVARSLARARAHWSSQ